MTRYVWALLALSSLGFGADAKSTASDSIADAQAGLNARQKKVLNGGFTTFSETEWFGAGINHRITCSIRFDTWEDRYDVTLLSQLTTLPTTEVVADFAAVAERCFAWKIPAELNQKTFAVTLNVKQALPEESEKVRSWLVRQQSGMMQGLFAHMLGDLSLTERSFVSVIAVQKVKTK